MSDFQKIIKYLAIAFAIYLVVVIVGAIAAFLGSFIFIFGSDNGITETIKTQEIDNKYEIKEIDIDIKAAELIIEEGETFVVETNNTYIETNQDKNKLEIKEKGHKWFRYNNESKLIIKLPSSIELDEFKLNAGAGKIEINTSITASNIYLELGAGQVIIDNLVSTKKAKINGGAGEMIIKNSTLNNLDFDMGVGRAEITSAILGESDIEAGVGELEINIIGNEEDYELEVEKGIGRIELDGRNLSNDSKYGKGPNKIDIDGGVGKIDIKFKDSNNTHQNENQSSEEQTKNTFTRTYKVLNKTSYKESNSYYLTLQIFEGEVDTVIIKDIKDTIEEGKTYEFTFEKNNSIKTEDNLKSIFNNYKLVGVTETNKEGLDQIQDQIN